MAAAESYPDDLKYHAEHDWARVEGDEAVLGDHVVRRGLARRARPLRGAGAGRDRDEGRVLRRGRVGEGGLRPDRAALRRGARGEPEGRRRARDGERRSVRRRLARPHPPRATRPRSTRCSTSPRTSRCWPSSDPPVPRPHRRRPRGDAADDRRLVGRRALPRPSRRRPLRPRRSTSSRRSPSRSSRRTSPSSPPATSTRRASSRSSAPASTTTTCRRSSTRCSSAASSSPRTRRTSPR